MECSYRIRVIKECTINASSDSEADQIAELMVNRELKPTIIGNPVFVYSEFERV